MGFPLLLGELGLCAGENGGAGISLGVWGHLGQEAAPKSLAASQRR